MKFLKPIQLMILIALISLALVLPVQAQNVPGNKQGTIQVDQVAGQWKVADDCETYTYNTLGTLTTVVNIGPSKILWVWVTSSDTVTQSVTFSNGSTVASVTTGSKFSPIQLGADNTTPQLKPDSKFISFAPNTLPCGVGITAYCSSTTALNFTVGFHKKDGK